MSLSNIVDRGLGGIVLISTIIRPTDRKCNLSYAFVTALSAMVSSEVFEGAKKTTIVHCAEYELGHG